jgi:thioesterase domain-containing protein
LLRWELLGLDDHLSQTDRLADAKPAPADAKGGPGWLALTRGNEIMTTAPSGEASARQHHRLIGAGSTLPPVIFSTHGGVLMSEFDSVKVEGPSRDRCRVSLTTAPAGAPVVNLVHPAGGSVACYRGLAGDLSPEVATAAFLPAALDGGVLDHDVESMAGRYLAEVPPGPVLLGGWSFGGLVAFEMARRLAAAGRVTGPLLLIDTPLPGIGAVDDAALAAEFEAELSRMVGAGDITAEERATRFEVFRTHCRAQVAYQSPGQVTNDLVVIARKDNQDAPRWQAHTTGRLRLRRLPADHYELMRTPHVGAITRFVKTTLITSWKTSHETNADS